MLPDTRAKPNSNLTPFDISAYMYAHRTPYGPTYGLTLHIYTSKEPYIYFE